MIYVLTGEPYHDNSVLLGAFTDKAEALEAFKKADTKDEKYKGDYFDYFVLTAADNMKAYHCLHKVGTIIFFAPDNWRTRTEITDLETFDFKNGDNRRGGIV